MEHRGLCRVPVDRGHHRALGDDGDLVRKSLDKRGYEIVRASVYTTGAGPIRPMRAEVASAHVGVAAPALEGGRSEITVRVNGSIELF